MLDVADTAAASRLFLINSLPEDIARRSLPEVMLRAAANSSGDASANEIRGFASPELLLTISHAWARPELTRWDTARGILGVADAGQPLCRRLIQVAVAIMRVLLYSETSIDGLSSVVLVASSEMPLISGVMGE